MEKLLEKQNLPKTAIRNVNKTLPLKENLLKKNRMELLPHQRKEQRNLTQTLLEKRKKTKNFPKIFNTYTIPIQRILQRRERKLMSFINTDAKNPKQTISKLNLVTLKKTKRGLFRECESRLTFNKSISVIH